MVEKTRLFLVLAAARGLKLLRDSLESVGFSAVVVGDMTNSKNILNITYLLNILKSDEFDGRQDIYHILFRIFIHSLIFKFYKQKYQC